jgi:methylase of polypeptide subunit release factors
MKHDMVVNMCQRLHFAPLGEDQQHILDMGTGTGIWAIESECYFPSAVRFMGMNGRANWIILRQWAIYILAQTSWASI